MDKQTNTLANPQDFTSGDANPGVPRGHYPVNTRTVGAPEGIYILYIEDYVHTFIRKILSDSTQGALPEDRDEKGDTSKNKIQQRSIALYGRTIEENGRYRIVIPGAAVCDGGSERIRQLNNTYFPSCSYIGNAVVGFNKDSGLRIELTLRSTRVILDDFYIYYDQNEEMQNYLVEWNTTRESDKGRIVLSPAGHSAGDAAHIGRITQAYNREEAKVSFMWNVMNVLCLGFVVCVMAYGIISMNNYNKMQNMQEKIDYCMAFVEENTSFLLGSPQTEAVMQQNVQAENETETHDGLQGLGQIPSTSQVEDNPVTDPAAAQGSDQSGAIPGTTQDSTQPGADPEVTQALAQAAMVAGDTQPAAEQTTQPAQEQPSTPQYYVVRRGDTLRTICYSIYGDYSRVDEVCRWNNIDDPDNILYGQKLLLP